MKKHATLPTSMQPRKSSTLAVLCSRKCPHALHMDALTHLPEPRPMLPESPPQVGKRCGIQRNEPQVASSQMQRGIPHSARVTPDPIIAPFSSAPSQGCDLLPGRDPGMVLVFLAGC